MFVEKTNVNALLDQVSKCLHVVKVRWFKMLSLRSSRLISFPLIGIHTNISYSRKDKPAAQILVQSFSWGEAIDAVADVYNGVRIMACDET